MMEYLDTIVAFIVIMLAVSLMITLLNQVISALLGYRGTNLRWGVQTVLSTLDSKLTPKARELANRVLTEPSISDSIFAKYKKSQKFGYFTLRWRLASAVGPDALVRALTKVSQELQATDADTAKRIKDLLTDIDPEAERRLKMVGDAFKHLAPQYAIQVDKMVKQLGTSVQESVGQLESWFNIVMNRASQRFTMQMRIWTVIFSFLIAFSIHLDTFSTFNQLWSNPALRQNLVNQSDAVQKEAAAVLGTQTGGGQNTTPTTSPEVLKEQMNALIDKDVDKQTEATPALLGAIPDFNTLSDAETWLRDGLKADDNRKEKLVAKYRGQVVAGLKKKANGLVDLLRQSGFQLMPGDQKISSFSDWINFVIRFDSLKSFVGVLITAALLSLGAPFWYNSLKTLSSLRPMVATRQDQNRQPPAAS